MSVNISIEKIDGLTGLRALAAFWVLAMHYVNGTPLAKVPFFDNGNFGVTIFFILSGFILHHNYSRYFLKIDKEHFIQYIFLRIARIYPIHLFMLFFYILILLPLKLPFIVPNDTPYTFILNIFLVHSWGFTDSLSWNQPAWSISIEFFSYLLLPFLLVFIRKIPKIAIPLIFVIIICLNPFTSEYCTSFSHAHRLLRYTLLFVGGVLAYDIFKPIRTHFIWDIICLMALFIILYGSLYQPIIFNKSLIVITSAFVLICTMNKSIFLNKYFFGNKILFYLGLTSYSLYMSHVPVMFLLRYNYSSSTPLVVELLLIQGIASILYHFVEEPCRRFIRSFTQSKLIEKYQPSLAISKSI